VGLSLAVQETLAQSVGHEVRLSLATISNQPVAEEEQVRCVNLDTRSQNTNQMRPNTHLNTIVRDSREQIEKSEQILTF